MTITKQNAILENPKGKKKKKKKSQRLSKHYGSIIFKERPRQSEVHYKRVMDENSFRYNCEMSNKMKELKKNSKEFWKLFNGRKIVYNSNISIETLFDFFKDLNKNKFEDNFIIENDINSDTINEELNGSISPDEIIKAVKKAENNKSPGDDLIINEYIASSLGTMIDVYVYLFNLIFETGILPEVWLIGNIIPIFKNKGCKLDPKNYRPITLLSCLGKICTSILNDRLTHYVENFDVLNENQAGFRPGYSTLDHIFSLYTPFELLSVKRKKYTVYL